MKKLIAFIISFLMLACFAVSAKDAAVLEAVGTLSAEEKTITVKIGIDSTEAFCGCSFNLTYDNELLDVVRKMNPEATVISLSAFCGAYHTELGEYIEKYNAENCCRVHYIDSNGWISPEPLHPYRDGHRTVAENLTAEMKKIING